jgi:hypothetical protein
MDRVPPKQLLLRPDGKAMTACDIRELHDEIACSDNIEWIDGATCEIVERFMPIW